MKLKVEMTLSDGKITGKVIYPFSKNDPVWYRFSIVGSSGGLGLKTESVNVEFSNSLVIVIGRSEVGIVQVAKDMLMEAISSGVDPIHKIFTVEI